MKARQHRKTVQRRMGHWIAGASWRRVMAHCAELTSSLADSYALMANSFADIEYISAVNGSPFAKHPANFGDPTVPWPWDTVVIDEHTQLKPTNGDPR